MIIRIKTTFQSGKLKVDSVKNTQSTFFDTIKIERDIENEEKNENS